MDPLINGFLIDQVSDNNYGSINKVLFDRPHEADSNNNFGSNNKGLFDRPHEADSNNNFGSNNKGLFDRSTIR
jgi:hypothetical protein